MKQKVRVGAVSYLNTKPFIYGLQNSEIYRKIELITDYPSKIAEKLYNNEIDLGLVPVSVIANLENHFLISDFCIGAAGPVASVCLFSNVPLAQIKTIVLDYQSRTSVALIKILATYFWKQNFEFIHASNDDELMPENLTAALVIGDRAFELKNKITYCYDLAEAWQNFTKLPFVFAAWISTKQLEEQFKEDFNAALKHGLNNIDSLIEKEDFKAYDLKKYYIENISYNFDKNKKKGLNLFLEYIKNNK